MERNADWVEIQTLISKFSDNTIPFDIFTKENKVIRLAIFDGVIFGRNELGKMISSRSWKGSISFSVDQGYPSYSDEQLELAKRLSDIQVIKPFYKSHPYHKLKNETLLSYDKGPRFNAFIGGLMEEPQFIYESDIDA